MYSTNTRRRVCAGTRAFGFPVRAHDCRPAAVAGPDAPALRMAAMNVAIGSRVCALALKAEKVHGTLRRAADQAAGEEA